MPSPKVTFRAQPALMQELQARGDSPGLISMRDAGRYYNVLARTRKHLRPSFTKAEIALLAKACLPVANRDWWPTAGDWYLEATVEEYVGGDPGVSGGVNVQHLLVLLRDLSPWESLAIMDALESMRHRIDAGESVDISQLLA